MSRRISLSDHFEIKTVNKTTSSSDQTATDSHFLSEAKLKTVISPNPSKQWFINTKKFYKVWFSKDLNNFLGIENELRFIRVRHYLHRLITFVLLTKDQPGKW